MSAGEGLRALLAAADEMEAVIADGDSAEVAAPVPGEVGRSAVMARRDALYNDPATWLREYANRALLADTAPTPEVDGSLVELLARHEARWTTHGWERLHQVIHCVSSDCDWSLRQKKSMTTNQCYDAHRTHLARVVQGWADKRVGGAVGEALEGLADELVWTPPEDGPCESPEPCCGSAQSCDAMQPSTKVVGEQWLRDRARIVREQAR